MNRLFLVVVLAGAVSSAVAKDRRPIANPAIDTEGFLRMTEEAQRLRQTRLVSEEDFIRMSGEPGTVVLDARSRERYDELHVKGAVNLSFPDITVESVQRVLPDKATRILIYCNNNFRGAERPFPMKARPAALNLSTYTSLYTYGYRNVYELGVLVDIAETRLALEGSLR
jgi:phage shock protein E